jgi:hypothetical protein
MQEIKAYENQFMTRFAFGKEHNVPGTVIADRVRRGEIALHLIDGRVMINVAEALKACVRRPRHYYKPKIVTVDLFA